MRRKPYIMYEMYTKLSNIEMFVRASRGSQYTWCYMCTISSLYDLIHYLFPSRIHVLWLTMTNIFCAIQPVEYVCVMVAHSCYWFCFVSAVAIFSASPTELLTHGGWELSDNIEVLMRFLTQLFELIRTLIQFILFIPTAHYMREGDVMNLSWLNAI